jgi:DNA polymerase phi
MSTTLPLFWDLSAASKQKRLKASSELITALERFQLGFEAQPAPPATDDDDAAMADGTAAAAGPAAGSDDDDDDDDDESGEEVDDSDDEAEEEHEVDPKEARRLDRELDRQNSEDVRYSIRRLVRGLASSRESSRLGFAVALTEVRLSPPPLLARGVPCAQPGAGSRCPAY